MNDEAETTGHRHITKLTIWLLDYDVNMSKDTGSTLIRIRPKEDRRRVRANTVSRDRPLISASVFTAVDLSAVIFTSNAD